MKIYFVGYLTSGFIKDDVEILEEAHDVTIFDLSINASSFKKIYIYLLSTLLEWRRVYNSDIVWIWFADYPALPFIVWAKLFRKPIVMHIGGWEVYSAPSINYGNQLNPIRGAVSRWIIRNSTVCVVPSEAYKKIVVALEPGANIVVISDSVSNELCNASLPEKHGVVTALTTMKFTRNLKGIPTFEKATEGIEAQIVENIPHDKLIEIFKSSKVYCQLSYTESFGVTLLESMACGCIPVVTDRDALPEVIGNCGIPVPYGDIEKTRVAILLALNADATDIVSVRNRARFFSRERKKGLQEKMLGEIWNHTN